MHENKELLDQPNGVYLRSGLFNAMSILAFVGNGLWAFLFLLLLIGCTVNGAAMMESTTLNNFFGGIVMFFALASLLMVLSCVVAFVGVLRMRKGYKRGFFLYAGGNGVWILVVFYAAIEGGMTYVLGGILSLLFIVYFASNLGKLK